MKSLLLNLDDVNVPVLFLFLDNSITLLYKIIFMRLFV